MQIGRGCVEESVLLGFSWPVSVRSGLVIDWVMRFCGSAPVPRCGFCLAVVASAISGV